MNVYTVVGSNETGAMVQLSTPHGLVVFGFPRDAAVEDLLARLQMWEDTLAGVVAFNAGKTNIVFAPVFGKHGHGRIVEPRHD